MKIKFLTLASVVLLVFGFALAASAGAILDTDGDVVPDVLDNCPTAANGTAPQPNPPNLVSNQTDSTVPPDGYGDVCDCDFDQDGFVLGNDIGLLFAKFAGTDPEYDVDVDGFVLGSDVGKCFAVFGVTMPPLL
jgi:hypothetical protein